MASEGVSSGMPWGSLRAPAGRLNGFLCTGDFPPGCAARRGGPAEPCLGLWGWGLRGGFGIKLRVTPIAGFPNPRIDPEPAISAKKLHLGSSQLQPLIKGLRFALDRVEGVGNVELPGR